MGDTWEIHGRYSGDAHLRGAPGGKVALGRRLVEGEKAHLARGRGRGRGTGTGGGAGRGGGTGRGRGSAP